ncbi:MAG: GtrA family protein [Patescibacteria group bacterium]
MPLVRRWYDNFRRYFSSAYPEIYSVCNQHKSVIKFIVAGCSAAGTDLVLLYVFYGLFGLDLVVSTSLAFLIAFLVSFSLQKFWAFRNYQDKVISQLFLYLLNALLGLYLNGFFMHLLVNKFQIWYMLAQFAVNLVLGFWNFVVYKFIIFKTNKP